jgi:hypothetical protein
VTERQFQFEWDQAKSASNLQKHGVPFEKAAAVFHDPYLLSVPDEENSDIEERWFSIGAARDGVLLSIVYLWKESSSGLTKIRLISARRATPSEARYYEESI